MGHRKRKSHKAEGSAIRSNCETVPKAANPVIDECLKPEAGKIWRSVLDHLERGQKPPPGEFWPKILFPFVFAVCPEGHPPEECWPFSLRGCIELLEHPIIGGRIGYAVQFFCDLSPKLTEGALSIVPGDLEREWIQGWMQLYNRILHMNGVEKDKSGREICERVLKRPDGWAHLKMDWADNKEIVETCGCKDPKIGRDKAGREHILPGWTPKITPDGKMSPFMEGICRAIADRYKLEEDMKKEEEIREKKRREKERKEKEKKEKEEKEKEKKEKEKREKEKREKEKREKEKREKEKREKEKREKEKREKERIEAEKREEERRKQERQEEEDARRQDAQRRRSRQRATQEAQLGGRNERPGTSNRGHSRRRRRSVYGEDRGPAHYDVDQLTADFRNNVRVGTAYSGDPRARAYGQNGPGYDGLTDGFRRH